jgi:nicotinic acid mononucleotide adenylyltransferase
VFQNRTRQSSKTLAEIIGHLNFKHQIKFIMQDFETEFLGLRNSFLVKYGEQVFKTPSYKGLGILMMVANFRQIPNSASFEDEINHLQNALDNMETPPVKEWLNETQEAFRINRLSEVVKECINTTLFNSETTQTNEGKIMMVETLGMAATGMIEKTLSSGHTVNELVQDHLRLYISQYKLYRQNPEHPIFLNAELEKNVTPRINTPTQKSQSSKGGCLGVTLFLFALIVSIIILVV